MKRRFLSVLALLIGIAGTVFGQTPATLPYSCDFEATGDNGWTLKNGTCTNKWHVGTFSSPAGHSGSLFISEDNGATAGYNTRDYSVVIAEKLFRTGETDSLAIGFDVTIDGEYNYDYLKVFWVPADTNFEAVNSSTYFAMRDYTTNVIMSNTRSEDSRYIHQTEGRQKVYIANEPNTLKKLVFVWKNDGGGGYQPGAIIDNISIVGVNAGCTEPTDLTVANISQTGFTLNWNGNASSYEVRLNGETPETVNATSKTFTGLASDEFYTLEVRSLCEDENSEWASLGFTYQVPVSLPYTCDFEAAGNNGWILKNDTCANKWYVGTFSSPAGHSRSLYISGDEGETAGYDTTGHSVVIAEKIFRTGEMPYLSIKFDLTVKGEPEFDMLKVFWAPADTNYNASTSEVYYAERSFGEYVIMSNADDSTQYYLSSLNGTQEMKVFIPNEPNSLKKLVFLWTNDIDYVSKPGAIIDNIEVREVSAPCDAPTDLTVSNISATGATVSWSGTTSDYEVRLNGGTPETVNTTSKTFTGLTNGTSYLIEVRSLCQQENSSPWERIEFCTQQTPVTLPYNCDFSATDNNGWLIKNGICWNKWFVGTPEGEGNRALYLSGDNGATASTIASMGDVVIAEKLFQTGTSEYISIDLDLEASVNTLGWADYLKIFWTPADSVFDATNDLRDAYAYYGPCYGDNVIMSNSGIDTIYYTCSSEGRQQMSITLENEPNTLKKLVFLWLGGERDRDKSVIIDNISIRGVDTPCEEPTDLTVSDISQNAATISWNGSASGYELRLNGGIPEVVTGTSKTLSSLTPGESYLLEVRAACTDSRSQWKSIGFSTSQYAVSIPYSCDFEATGNNGWSLKDDDNANEWYIGTTTELMSGSLYISGSDGASVEYDRNNRSIAIAEKTFLTGTGDSLTISFDLLVGGEAGFDFLKVFWAPADSIFEADRHAHYADSEWDENVIINNSGDTQHHYMSNMDNTERISVNVPNEPNTLKKLVFLWKNDSSDGDQPGAIVDNISITETTTGEAPAPCYPPADFAVTNITATSATVSWSGLSSTYEIKLNGGTTETVNGTSKTFTGLTGSTVYMVELRTVCESNNSPWISTTFMTNNVAPELNTLAATDITETNATLHGSITRGSEIITSRGFEYRKQGSSEWLEVFVTSAGENMSMVISNLESETAYEYRVFAETDDEDYEGQTMTFTTLQSLGLAEIESGISAIVYPNPAKDRATLSLKGLTANARIIVNDIQGRIVLTDNIAKGSESYELDLDGFASGIYTIAIISGKNKTTHKLIVE